MDAAAPGAAGHGQPRGLLYERFGPNGVGVGMLVMGLAMLVIGLVWARYAWPRRV
ncbi:hypothetical protein FHY30_003954 [Xanthomonas arboricola]|nr:hypothetical protein [Xanthomonas campestris]